MKKFIARLMKASIGFSVASLLMSNLGFSQSMLDQFYAPTNATQCDSFAVNFNGASHGQTFTVGLPGFITSVDVFIGRNELQTDGDISWTLRSTIAGVPVAGAAGVLASGMFPYGNLSIPYTYQSCLIPLGLVPVTPGTVLGITLSSDNMFTWAGHDGSPYPRGSHQVGGPDGPWITDIETDLGFKTFVAAVPEPSTLAIYSLGGCMLLMTRSARSGLDRW
jgi:hypothetical protein